MKNSNIEWTHHTANLWWGCVKVHAGCDNCYAMLEAKRRGNDVWGNDKPRRQIKNVWMEIEKYQKNAAEKGEIHRVFVGSMMDIFEKPMPLVDHKGIPHIENESELYLQYIENIKKLKQDFFINPRYNVWERIKILINE